MDSKPKECFVAFIDILGFSDMIEKDNGSGLYLKEVKNALEKGNRLLKEKQSESGHNFSFWFDEFKVKSFSDCFCFSIPLEFDRGEKDYKQNFLAFYVWIHVFYNELLNLGFLCRGGISQGWHYSDEDIIFSKALVSAYKVESKYATYPIIMIDQLLMNNLNHRFTTEENYFNYMFAHDNAGRNFLHPFNYSIVDELFFGDKSVSTLSNHIDIRNILLTQYDEIINQKIEENKGNMHVEKYQWLKEFLQFTRDNQYRDKFFTGLEKSL